MDQADSCIVEPQIELTTAVDGSCTTPKLTPMARVPFNIVRPTFSDMCDPWGIYKIIGHHAMKNLQITRRGFVLLVPGQSR